ncbi:extensin family protein [Hoeflea sp. YIM 152468]|uniref:extensin-like domain-containing protein n=1 Tax=Hoeflea sp. YIM 152468 TaxID=3031759 RepID=UPI0023DC8695|nr:extensin family protein [Hoeflea sp. YIM 152468]MDF1609745.1 extensin family protein [Hoeflea sp. YIM 152468]
MRRLLALPVLLVVCMGSELPENGPIPDSNPRRPASPETAVPHPAPAPSPGMTNPDGPASAEAATPSRDQKTGASDEPASLPESAVAKADETALAHCEAQLRKLGAVFERQDSVRGDKGCGMDATYSIDQIIRGVSLSPASQMRCQTALALANWTDKVVLPATSGLPDKPRLAAINHGSTYACRRRNNSATGKLSEHATGNAIDIMEFGFSDRKPIGISPRKGDGDIEEAFQRAVRGGACLHFTTVLGPGTNAAHANHLHLDIIKRKRGYRLCQ